MAASQIQKELTAYLPLLSSRQQEILLDMVKNLLNIDKKETRISLDEYNEELSIALKQIKAGEIVSHAEVMKQSKKWLKQK